MTRTREFDPTTALDSAMKVFWRKGYYATSIEDLVEATGVSRYGLYSVFDSKRGLFLASLDHYRANVVQLLASALYQPGASVGVIQEFLETLGEIAGKPHGRLGCLLWNTASEVAPHDKVAARKVAEFRAYLTNGFRAALANAVVTGEMPGSFKVAREADFLASVVQTLSILARSHTEPDAITNYVAVSLSTLR